METGKDFFDAGYRDAAEGRDKNPPCTMQFDAYMSGYRAGTAASEQSAAAREVPAYYDQDGGCMWNGLGRDYF